MKSLLFNSSLRSELEFLRQLKADCDSRASAQVSLFKEFMGAYKLSKTSIVTKNKLDTMLANVHSMSDDTLKLSVYGVMTKGFLLLRDLGLSFGKSDDDILTAVNMYIVREISDAMHNLPNYLILHNRQGLIAELSILAGVIVGLAETGHVLKPLAHEYHRIIHLVDEMGYVLSR